MNNIVILCGKTGAGKTTYAERLVEEGKQAGQKTVILSVDEAMLKLSDQCEGRTHHLEISRRVNDYFLGLSLQFLEQDIRCIFDFGYWTREERDQIRRFYQERKIPFDFIWVDAPEDVRQKRLERRNEENRQKSGRQYQISSEMLQRFDGWFETPDKDENIIKIET